MKLDKMKFANLCVKLQGWLDDNKNMLSAYDIEELDNMINVDVEVSTVTQAQLDMLLAFMAGGTHKIDAIRCYRALTGVGLKDAKDAVERHWVSKPLD